MNNSFRSEISLTVLIAIIYMLWVFNVPFAILGVVFTPLILIKLFNINGKKPMPYAALIFLFIMGFIKGNDIQTVVYILLAIVPALSIYFLHKTSNRGGVRLFSNHASVLAPLPFFLIYVIAVTVQPEILESLKQSLLMLFEESYKMQNFTDLERLDSNNKLALLYENRHEYISFLISLVPTIVYSTMLLLTFSNEAFFFGFSSKTVYDLSIESISVLTVVIVVFASLFLFLHYSFIEVLRNIIIIYGSILFLRGFTVIRFNMDKWKVPTFIRVVFYIFIAISYHVAFIIAAFGFASLFVNMLKVSEVNE